MQSRVRSSNSLSWHASPPVFRSVLASARPMALPSVLARAVRAVRAVSLAALTLCAALLATLPLACSTAAPGTPVVDEDEAELPPTPRSMRVVSAFGGAHRALVIDGAHWFQTFANRALILDAQTGTLISDIELSPRGTTGPAVDLALHRGGLFVVLEDDAVVELDVSNVRAPRLRARWGRPELGIAPRRLSVLDDTIWVSGVGGAIKLADAPIEGESRDEKGRPTAPTPPLRFLSDSTVGTIVDATDGPAACVGRRILRVGDGAYLGAASMLIPAPAEFGGGYAFVLQGNEGAQVGLMGTDFRERSSSAVQGLVRAIRIHDDRLFVVTDAEVSTWKLEATPGRATTVRGEGTQLGSLVAVRVRGALDVGKVKRNRFAVSGTFGRSLYRYLPEGDQDGDTFYWSERAPGRLDVSQTDRRRILAASDEGAWMYLIEESAELVTRDIVSPDQQSARAEVSWGAASCDERREEVLFRVADRAISLRPSRDGLVSTLASADGRIWIGHDRGIDVVGLDPVTGELVVEDSIFLSGPIVAIYPNRVGGGVSYVARLDGFGVIRPVPVTDPPIKASGTVCGFCPADTDETNARAGSTEKKR